MPQFIRSPLGNLESTMAKSIEELIKSEKWKAARKLIQSELKEDPKNHWLLSRLSLTHYEEFNYKQALTISKKAYAIDPKCPLVLWDLAGSLDMLGREKDAIKIYRSLVNRGVESLAYGTCGEGLVKARMLIADCMYRLFLCYRNIGEKKMSQTYLRKHLSLRARGWRSIYSLREVKRKVA